MEILLDIFIFLSIFAIGWAAIGFMLIQLNNFFTKTGAFSKVDNWTGSDLSNEIIMSLNGPFLIFYLLYNLSDVVILKKGKNKK